MKLLLFSDLHINKRCCEMVVSKSRHADIVVGAGDFGSLRQGLDKTIQWLSAIKKPSILVPGNSESYEELVHACANWESAIPIHGSGVALQGINFYGIGGGIPITPFGSWSYDFSEEEAWKLVADCPENAVLISHSPPWGVLDRSSEGLHLGSQTIREAIVQKTPRLVVCGHIHESGGKIEKLQNTVIINAGPMGISFDLNG